MEGSKISCAIIGIGAFGKHYVRLLSNNPRVSLTAITSPSVHSRDLGVHETVKRYTDAQNVFDDPSIEAVVIATPASTHAELTIRALKSGKHVLLEKPLAVNLDEAAQIENAANDSQKVFMLGHQYLYNDHISTLKNELESGRIGAVRYVHAEQLYLGPIRHDIGCFTEAATHEIALVDYLFAPGLPVSVQASAIDLSGGMREDFAAATIRYETGLLVHIVISSYSPVRSRRMIFGAENGMALFDDRNHDHKVSFFLRPYPKTEKLGQQKSLPIPEGDTFVPQVTEREPLLQEIEHFLDCIQNGTTPRSDIAHAMRVSRVLAAVSQTLTVI
jgi:predicted dehydrogenase